MSTNFEKLDPSILEKATGGVLSEERKKQLMALPKQVKKTGGHLEGFVEVLQFLYQNGEYTAEEVLYMVSIWDEL